MTTTDERLRVPVYTPPPVLPDLDHSDIVQPRLVKRQQNIWRENLSTYNYSACKPVTLSHGIYVIGSTTVTVSPESTNRPVFHPLCIYGRPVAGTVPIHTTGHSVVSNQLNEWRDWVTREGEFASCVVPVMYTLATSSATCWLVTLVILGFQRRRPLLYKFALVCTSVYLLVVLIRSIDILNQQFCSGYLDSVKLRYLLRTTMSINVLNLAFNTILYLAQVQITMMLFNRQKDKRLVLWLGVLLTIVAQTIWGISNFHPASSETSLPAFAYLFQIAMGVLYTGCVLFYAITKHESTLQPSLLLFSFLAVISAASPIILFIVDIANIWIVEWTDGISWFSAVLSLVTVCEWHERIYRLERHREKNGILGRKLYDDDDSGSNSVQPTDKSKLQPDNPDSTNSSFASQSITDTSGNEPSSSDQINGIPGQVQGTAQRYPGPTHRPGMTSRSVSHATVSHPNVTHVVIDSPFHPYEDKKGFLRYFQKAAYPLIVASDLIINIGLSISRPLTSASPDNSTPKLIVDDSQGLEASSSENSTLRQYVHATRKSKTSSLPRND